MSRAREWSSLQGLARNRVVVVAVAAALFAASGLSAAEGALGRPITGMQALPFAGVIPPDPGLIWQVGYIYYGGEISGKREVPIGGFLAAGLEVQLSLATATGTYIWNTKKPRWNFASMVTVPYIAVDVEAELTSRAGVLGRSDDASDFFDLFFAPIIASYHVSEVEHWSFGLYAYAPTADYEVGRLANPGLNVWTVMPTVGYTRLFSQGTFEVSGLAGLELYTENEDTNYQNGEIFRLDVLMMKRFQSGWGVGAVGGWIEQISKDDGGPLTELTDGFQGRALGLGPAIAYSRKTQAGNQIDFNVRWVPEFNVKNRFEGDAVQATLTLNF